MVARAGIIVFLLAGGCAEEPGSGIVGGPGGGTGACRDDGDCAGAQKTCCGGRCVDTAVDEGHCGSCGRACDAGNFCALSACKPVAIGTVCSFPDAVLVYDGEPNDAISGNMLADAVAARCSPPVSVARKDQTDPSAVDPASGRPALGAERLLLAAGGSFRQKVVDYLMNATRQTRAYYASDATTHGYFERGNAVPLVQQPDSAFTDQHDFFHMEFVHDASTGTAVAFVYGVHGQGTRAGAWHFAHTVLPRLATEQDAWAVVEWIDGDDDHGPSAADTFRVVKSGR